MDASQRILTTALVVSTVAHAAVLAVQFVPPEAPRMKTLEAPLDVILVNARQAAKPFKAEALAQANLDGGGEAATGRAKSFLTRSNVHRDGDKLSDAAARQQQLEEEQQKLLSQIRDAPSRVPAAEVRLEQQPDPKPAQAQVSGAELLASAQAILRREAEIYKRIEDENARPKRGYFTPATREVEYAMYFRQWADKVERVGNINYPDAARGRVYRLVMTVSVLADGRVEKVDIHHSSGTREIDNAARRIVKLAEPYGRFSPQMQARYGVIDLTMTWVFSRADALSVE